MDIEDDVTNEFAAAELLVQARNMDAIATVANRAAAWLRFASKRLMPPPETPNTNQASHHSG